MDICFQRQYLREQIILRSNLVMCMANVPHLSSTVSPEGEGVKLKDNKWPQLTWIPIRYIFSFCFFICSGTFVSACGPSHCQSWSWWAALRAASHHIAADIHAYQNIWPVSQLLGVKAAKHPVDVDDILEDQAAKSFKVFKYPASRCPGAATDPWLPLIAVDCHLAHLHWLTSLELCH